MYYNTLCNNLLLFIIILCSHSSNTPTVSIPFYDIYSSSTYVNNTLQELKTSFTFNAGFLLIRQKKNAYSQLHADGLQSKMLLIIVGWY